MLCSNLKKLITTSFDNIIKVWDLNKPKCLKRLIGHTDTIITFEFSSNGYLISGSQDKTLKVWNIENGRESLLKTISFTQPINCLKSINQNTLVIGSYNLNDNSNILIYDLKNEKIIKSFHSHNEYVWKLMLLSNGNLVTCGGNQLRLWSFIDSNKI